MPHFFVPPFLFSRLHTVVMKTHVTGSIYVLYPRNPVFLRVFRGRWPPNPLTTHTQDHKFHHVFHACECEMPNNNSVAYVPILLNGKPPLQTDAKCWEAVENYRNLDTLFLYYALGFNDGVMFSIDHMVAVDAYTVMHNWLPNTSATTIILRIEVWIRQLFI